MPKANVIQTNFTSGELSPQMRGRVDTTKYSNGVAELHNFLPKPQGGITRRPGTKYIATTKDNGYAIAVPFKFSNVQAYLIEFGDEYIRFYRNDTLVTGLDGAKTVTAVALVGPANAIRQRLTVTAHGYTAGDVIVVKNDAGDIVPNGETYVHLVVDANTFDIPPSTKANPNIPSVGANYTVQKVGSSTLELVSPYVEGHLDQLSFAQSADVLYICHPAYAPRKLSRTNSYDWALSEITFIDGPYMSIDESGIQLTVSSITDRATMLADGSYFAAGDVNEYVEWRENGMYHLAKIQAYTSATQVTVDILSNVIKFLDPRVPVSYKSNLVPRTGDGLRVTDANTFRNVFNATYPPPGLSARYRRDIEQDDGIDPSISLAESVGTVTATNFSQVFSRRDIGKYLRVQGTWYKITSNVAADVDTQVGVGAALPWPLSGAPDDTDNLRISPGSRTITATLTASAALFASSDVGRLMRLQYGKQWVWLKITAFGSTTSVTVALYDDFPTDLFNHEKLFNKGRTDIWRWGAWSATTGYPSNCCFHEQRLVFARTDTEPQTKWFSRSGDFENFAPSQPRGVVRDDNGFAYTLASGEVNSITWMVSHKVLVTGTVGGEWQMRAATSISNPITPTDVAITPETSSGSFDYARAIKISSRVLHLSRSGKKLREMKYSFEDDAWISNDLTIASEHILRGGTNGCKLEFQREPTQVVWVLLADGTMASLTYEPEQQVFAWAQHEIGGSGIVESFAVIPNSTGAQSDLYLIVKRTVNGNVKRYIEKLDQEFTSTSTSDMHFLDSYETGTGNTTITGLTRLEGLSVRVVKAGVDVGAYTVTGGEITGVTGGNTTYTVGLNYTSRLRTLPPEGGSPSGTSQGKLKRIHRFDIRVHNSVGMSYATYIKGTIGTLVEKVFNSNSLTTGDSYDDRIEPSNIYESENALVIATEKAYALTILSLMPSFKTNE